MIVHYGYIDASGEFFITVDDSKCLICQEKGCIKVCPKSALVEEENDYGDIVMVVRKGLRNKLKYVCADCKPNINRPPLPCVSACPYNAISHSW